MKVPKHYLNSYSTCQHPLCLCVIVCVGAACIKGLKGRVCARVHVFKEVLWV